MNKPTQVIDRKVSCRRKIMSTSIHGVTLDWAHGNYKLATTHQQLGKQTTNDTFWRMPIKHLKTHKHTAKLDGARTAPSNDYRKPQHQSELHRLVTVREPKIINFHSPENSGFDVLIACTQIKHIYLSVMFPLHHVTIPQKTLFGKFLL